jgi:hypothetical protein
MSKVNIGDQDTFVTAYEYMRKNKSKEEALKWADSLFPARQRGGLSRLMFGNKQYDLLWEFFPEPEKSGYPDLVWLMRACASAKLGNADPHRKELIEYYKNRTATLEDSSARFLLDLMPKDQYLALAETPVEKCNVAYYLGLKAEGAGNLAEASDWYRIAVETGQTNTIPRTAYVGPYYWAHDTLNTWCNEGKKL